MGARVALGEGIGNREEAKAREETKADVNVAKGAKVRAIRTGS
jgi:hypothetical protein